MSLFFLSLLLELNLVESFVSCFDALEICCWEDGEERQWLDMHLGCHGNDRSKKLNQKEEKRMMRMMRMMKMVKKKKKKVKKRDEKRDFDEKAMPCS